MFGPLGGPEFLLLAVLALLLFGPRKLPQIGRSLGRAMAEFRGATQEFKRGLEKEVELEELRKTGKGLAETGKEIRGSIAEDDTRQSVPRSDADPSDDQNPSKS